MLPILIFLSNELCDPAVQRNLRIPLTFINFAIMPLHMYEGPYSKKSTFLLPHTRKETADVVYGAIFLLHDADYYIRTLDAYHLCSLSVMRRNHVLDTQHRIESTATPIAFSSIDELARLLYTEGEPARVSVYVGNPHQPIIQKCLRTTVRRRVTSGVDRYPLTNLLKEVLHERLI